MNNPFPKNCLHCGSEYVLLESMYSCGTYPGQPPTGHCLQHKRESLEQDNDRLRSKLADHSPEGHNVTNRQFVDLLIKHDQLVAERDRARNEAEKLKDEVAFLKAMLHGTRE